MTGTETEGNSCTNTSLAWGKHNDFESIDFYKSSSFAPTTDQTKHHHTHHRLARKYGQRHCSELLGVYNMPSGHGTNRAYE